MRRQRRGLVQYESRYLNWMSFATAGMFHPGHRHLIDLAVLNLPTEDPVLEIGSFCGLSTNVIAYFLAKHGRRNAFFATDPWVFEGETETLPDSSIPFDDYRALVREQFDRNVRFWSADRLPHAIPMASDEFFERWGWGETVEDVFRHKTLLGGPLAFCFIDGAHERGQVERDFRHVDELLVRGGFILFDDSDEFGAFPQVHEVMRAALAEGRYELVAANPHHLLRKR
jgi:Methyltransferase domain